MKYDRHAKLLEIIENNEINTQEEIVERFKALGFEVTQATVSRDIKDLRLIKVLTGSGKYKYAPYSLSGDNISGRLMNILQEVFVSVDYANNMVVVKTLSGMAQAAAAAIDSLKLPEIVGTIGGDDTTIIICRAEKIADELVVKLNKMIKQGV